MKIQRNRFIFILLKSLKFSLDYKNFLFDNFSKLDKLSHLTYKNFFYLYIIQEEWKNKLEVLFKNYILQYFKNNFQLKFKQLDYIEKKKDFFFFLYSYNVCLIYFKFLKLIQKIFSMQRRRYLNYFFRVMLEYKRKQRFLYFFNASEGIDNFINFSKIINDLDNELYYNHIYRNLVVFLNLYYWKIQFKHTYLKGNEFSLCFSSLTTSLYDSYKKYRKIWFVKLLDFRIFYKMFKCFLIDFINDYKLFFFFLSNFNKNLLKLDNYFVFYTLFSYLYKLNNLYKYEEQGSLTSLENFLSFSDFFLGKWFYQRHLSKTFDSTKFELNNFFPYIFKFNHSSFVDQITNSFKLLILKNRCIETKVLDYFSLKNDYTNKLLKKSNINKVNNFKRLLSSFIFFTSADERMQRNKLLNKLSLRYKWWTKRRKHYKNSLRKISVLKKKKFFIRLYTQNFFKKFSNDIYKIRRFQNLQNFAFTNDFFFMNNYKVKRPRYRFRQRTRRFYRFFNQFCKMNSMVYKDRKKKKRLKFFRYFKKQYFRKRQAKNIFDLENKAFTNAFLILFHKRTNNNTFRGVYYYWWFNK